jgi:hypothetical protein
VAVAALAGASQSAKSKLRRPEGDYFVAMSFADMASSLDNSC